jgi:hypothetical protein
MCDVVLRLLHVDRASRALNAMEQIIIAHGRELRAATFLSVISLLFMTAAVDVTEHTVTVETGMCEQCVGALCADDRETFDTYAETLWWGFETMTTIG